MKTTDSVGLTLWAIFLAVGICALFGVVLLHESGWLDAEPVAVDVYDPKPEIEMLNERVLLLEGKFQFSTEGVASWYGDREQGRPTASGEIFDHHGYTAASRVLPLGTFVIVENISNRKKVVVKVNDRGPYIDGRLIDLSEAAAKTLGFHKKGLEKVKVTVIQFGN